MHELIFLSFVINSSRYGFSFYLSIQLFQERLSEKVHATIPKGIVGDFEFTIFQRNFKEWHEKPWTYVCES